MTDPAIRHGRLQANGLSVAYLEAGTGPVVLLLHGFPDNAWTWERQLVAVAEAGFRAVAPFLRGYPPTEIPDDGGYDPGTLAEDVIAVAEGLGAADFALIGHDQGAMVTHATLALSPQRVSRAAVLGVGHPLNFARLFEYPELVGHLAHMWFFQLQDLANIAVSTNDYAYIDYLWEHLSAGDVDATLVQQVKEERGCPVARRSS